MSKISLDVSVTVGIAKSKKKKIEKSGSSSHDAAFEQEMN